VPKRSNNFQRLIASIEMQLAPIGAVVTESKLIKEKSSDTEREVDIAIESNVGQHNVLIAIECRDRSRPANLEWIDGLIGKYRDLPVEKVVAVSRSGFTKAAIRKAEEVNISTVALESAIEAKLIPNRQGRVIPIKYPEHDPPDFHLCLHKENFERLGDYAGDPKRGNVHNPDGGSEGPLVEILKSQATLARIAEANIRPSELKEGPLTPITLKFPEGTTIVDDDGKSYRLREVEIEQSVKIQTAEIQLNSFRYMDVELLSGEFETETFKVHVLLLYKEGADTYQYAFGTQGDIIAADFSFGNNPEPIHLVRGLDFKILES
jgi:hypothetical protein